MYTHHGIVYTGSFLDILHIRRGNEIYFSPTIYSDRNRGEEVEEREGRGKGGREGRRQAPHFHSQSMIEPNISDIVAVFNHDCHCQETVKT